MNFVKIFILNLKKESHLGSSNIWNSLLTSLSPEELYEHSECQRPQAGKLLKEEN